jgi:Protein of unknown function (DUF1579)
MKKVFVYTAAAILMVACNENAPSNASTFSTRDSVKPVETKKEPVSTAPLDSAIMMKNWENYMTPSDAHKKMATWNGNWNGDVTMWQAPGAPPMNSKTTVVNKMILGGRYQESIHAGNMMGMAFEGRSIMGYDNAKKSFTNTWIDNTGTGTMILDGLWDETTKTITLKGKMIDPSAGNSNELDVRETYKVIDDKNHVMEMFAHDKDGKEFKTMEIKFTRK